MAAEMPAAPRPSLNQRARRTPTASACAAIASTRLVAFSNVFTAFSFAKHHIFCAVQHFYAGFRFTASSKRSIAVAEIAIVGQRHAQIGERRCYCLGAGQRAEAMVDTEQRA